MRFTYQVFGSSSDHGFGFSRIFDPAWQDRIQYKLKASIISLPDNIITMPLAAYW